MLTTRIQYALYQILRFWSVTFLFAILQAFVLSQFGNCFYNFFSFYISFSKLKIGLASIGPQLALFLPAFWDWCTTSEKENEFVKKQKKSHLYFFVFVNHIFLSSIIGYIWCKELLTQNDIMVPCVFWKLMTDFLKMIFITDFLFWFFHFLFHTSILYQHFHYLHHQVIYPDPLSTFYVDPIEHIFVNLVPILIAPLCIQPHSLLLIVWLTTATFSAVHNHTSSYSEKKKFFYK